MVDLQFLDSILASHLITLAVQAESFILHSFPSVIRTIPSLNATLKLKPISSEQRDCVHSLHGTEAKGEASKPRKNRHGRSDTYCQCHRFLFGAVR